MENFIGTIEIFSTTHNRLIFTSGAGLHVRANLESWEEYIIIRRLGPNSVARAMCISLRIGDLFNVIFHNTSPQDSLGYCSLPERTFILEGTLEDDE